jgi:hypothetical protein
MKLEQYSSWYVSVCQCYVLFAFFNLFAVTIPGCVVLSALAVVVGQCREMQSRLYVDSLIRQ